MLAAALKALEAVPTAERHRRVAYAYWRRGVLDTAYAHLAQARDLDPTDAAASAGMALIWREWGFPHLGLSDAYKALYFAAASPAVHNTLGTLLQALGRRQSARERYRETLTLDPRAAYAYNNLCYISFLDGNFDRALAQCRAALQLAPGLVAARNNLGLVYAARGRLDRARQEFFTGGDAATGHYNMGIVHLANRDYAQAAEAFDAAVDARPSWSAALARASQARHLLTQPW